jgi:PAS domain S-box-containing protein
MILDRPDRRERTLLTSSVPIRDAQGKIGGAVGVFQDITERRQMETALRESQTKLEIRVQERTAELAAANRDLQNESAERSRITEELSASEERFRQLAEHVREVFWMSEADYNRILYVSPVYEQLTGHTCQSLYERSASFLEFVHDEDRQQLLDQLVTQSAKSSEAEYRVVRPDGSVR